MSRLDRHVASVQNKLAFQLLMDALAWMALAYIVAAWVAVLAYKLVGLRIPAQSRLALIAAGVAVVAGVVYAMMRRPRVAAAAVAIDERLKLKEKFSTALSVRQSSDPFARAVVLDAEQTAQNVRLQNQFPLKFPRGGYAAIVAAFAVFLTVLFVPAMDLMGRVAQTKKTEEQKQVAAAEARNQVQQALSAVEALPKVVTDNNEDLRILQKDLENLASQQALQDPDGAKRKAVEALQEVKDALGEAGERERKVVAEQNREFNEKLGDLDEKGPMGDVAKDMKNGNVEKAAEDLEKTVEKFNEMKPEDKEKTAEEMAKMAEKLGEMAKDPAKEQELEQKLKDAGATTQQAQQVAKDMQKAANGDKQAQQNLMQQAQQLQNQLSQQIQQAQQQAAQGNPAAQQQLAQLKAQQQALSKAMQSGQAQANSQAQANAMPQAAQQMAQAMQAQAQAQSSGSQGSQKPGGSQQSMAQGQQAMKNAMAQMQQARSDQQSIAAQQAAAAKAAQNAANACNGNCNGNGNQPGSQPGQTKPGGTGQWAQGDPGNPGTGQGGPGIGNGGKGEKTVAPFDFVPAMDAPDENKDGKLLSGTMIKDQSVRGESKAKLSQIAESKLKEGTDEVEEDHVSGPNLKAAREYFRTMAKEPTGN